MKQYSAEKIRNVAIVGHGGCGKTSLASALLFNGGAVNRLGRVEDGTTVTDFDPDEIERKISLQAALAFGEWNKVKLNLLDAPGYALMGLVVVIIAGLCMVTSRFGVYRILNGQH